MKYLIVVDVQNDFINGSLGTKEAEEMYPRLLKKLNDFEGKIILTQDTHYENYLETQEGRNLPINHCIENTEGWEFPKELEELRKKNNLKVYKKPTFGNINLANDLKKIYDNGILESVELVGLCTDICVISNALLIKSEIPELPIYVDGSCCAGVTKEKHNNALDVMSSCQIKVK